MINISFLIQQKNMNVPGQKLDQRLKELMVEKKFFMKKSYCKVGTKTEDDLPLNESLKFLTLTVNINLVFRVDNKLYPQIYLNECFYEL